jgi:hypothetical protein
MYSHLLRRARQGYLCDKNGAIVIDTTTLIELETETVSEFI